MRYLPLIASLAVLMLFTACAPSSGTVREVAGNTSLVEAPEAQAHQSGPESSEANQEVAVPNPADPEVPAGIGVAAVYEGFQPSSGVLAAALPTFHPLGWSPKGAFGFIEIREDSGRGGYSVHLHIQDMISDEYVARESALDWDHAALETYAWPQDSREITGYFIDFWQEQIDEALLHPRDPSTMSAFQPLPIVFDGVSYFGMIEKAYGGEDPAMDAIEAYDYWLRGNDETRKLIFSASPRAVEVGTAGYFLSPFEPRAAVVILEERFTFEGTEPFAVIAGSRMDMGFEPVSDRVGESED